MNGGSPSAGQPAPTDRLTFQAASVRPGRPGAEPEVAFTLGPGEAYVDTGGRFFARNVSLLDYLRFAYRLDFAQANFLEASAPKKLLEEVFDIDARAEKAHPNKDQMRSMMQSLLAERFGLQVHTETRSMPALMLLRAREGRLGPQLRQHAAGDRLCSDVVGSSNRVGTGQKASQDVSAPAGPCGVLMVTGVPGAPGRLHVEGRDVTAAQLVIQLGQMGQYRRPLVDGTGLPGTYDVRLEWGSETATDATGAMVQHAPADDEEVQADLQEALRDQLGLKLERRSAALPVLLIDHINPQPTPN